MKHPKLFAVTQHMKSLPSRGAWIETRNRRSHPQAAPSSLPSRGAWIETIEMREAAVIEAGRSPHGGRGLKPIGPAIKPPIRHVAPLTGGVD